MGRPPCCDKVGVKKGPWAPEEDIMLVSYVQEHGPGNWRAVPGSTGLRRCSKSCRLRWTNYLRPGIKRGKFTDHEEKMIIQLQALLGNKWAAIAAYLPERTDNDIKNYWNTHLKKKLKKLKTEEETQSSSAAVVATDEDGSSFTAAPVPPPSSSSSFSRGQWERRLQADIKTAKQALQDALSSENAPQLFKPPANPAAAATFSYASSTENIARLLKQWERSKPKSQDSRCSSTQNSSNNPTAMDSSCSDETPTNKIKSETASFKFEDMSRSASPSVQAGEDMKPDPGALAPLSMLESWLLEDQGKDYLTNFSFDGNPDLF